jgi:hypothetical protein
MVTVIVKNRNSLRGTNKFVSTSINEIIGVTNRAMIAPFSFFKAFGSRYKIIAFTMA